MLDSLCIIYKTRQVTYVYNQNNSLLQRNNIECTEIRD